MWPFVRPLSKCVGRRIKRSTCPAHPGFGLSLSCRLGRAPYKAADPGVSGDKQRSVSPAVVFRRDRHGDTLERTSSPSMGLTHSCRSAGCATDGNAIARWRLLARR